MCGIWALFGSNGDIQKQVMASLRLAHRGPDQFRIETVNHYPNCALAFHRLTIMEDLEGMQPYKTHHYPHLTLCYNGEIYNYKQLAERYEFETETGLDGECILHLYNQGGAEFAAAQLDGVFAFIILDVKTKTVSIARDTYGIRPCFRVLTKDGMLGIGSEAKALHDLHGTKDQVECVAPFKPGTVAVYDLSDEGNVTLRAESQFHEVGTTPAHARFSSSLGDDVSANIRELLMKAVRKRMMGVRRIGCFLSGGVDSSLIAALVSKVAKEMELPYKIQTFSIGLKGSTDIAAARVVAKHLGTDHHEVYFTPEDGLKVISDVLYHNESYDVSMARGSIAQYLLSRYISKTTENIIMMSGEGGDEVTMGYHYFHMAPDPETADKDSRRLLRDFYIHDALRADRTTAAHGLELRVPYLDHQFCSYYLSIPAEQRIPQKGIEKYFLRQSFAGSGLLPDQILWRPKEGFSDGVSAEDDCWHEMLKDFTSKEVTDEEMAAAGSIYPFNSPTTKESFYYRKIFEQHFPGRSEWIPYSWTHRWVDEADPSCRVLSHYKSSIVQMTNGI